MAASVPAERVPLSAIKTVHAVALADIDRVRMRCKTCKGLIELSVVDFVKRFENEQSPHCPLCPKSWSAAGTPVRDLCKAVSFWMSDERPAHLEFVIADSAAATSG
jgi:hypothetical protein